MPILCTLVHLGITNNVAGGWLVFHCSEKPFSIFWVPKTRCSVKQPPNESFKMVPPHFSKIFTHQISPYFYTNGISPNQRAWFTTKDIPSNSSDVVRAHLEAADMSHTPKYQYVPNISLTPAWPSLTRRGLDGRWSTVPVSYPQLTRHCQLHVILSRLRPTTLQRRLLVLVLRRLCDGRWRTVHRILLVKSWTVVCRTSSTCRW